MAEVLDAFLFVFAALFPVINPPGSGLVYVGATRHYTSAVREAVARRVAVYAFVLLVVSLFLGSYILKIFGISVPVLRVAGGAVVAAMGWRLLHTSDEDRDDSGGADLAVKNLEQRAFYPLTMPLTAGPGSIAVTVAIGTGGPTLDEGGRGTHFVLFSTGAILATACICFAIYICYAYADRVKLLIGETGISIMLRLSAFILLCIGVQILWGGVSELWRSLS